MRSSFGIRQLDRFKSDQRLAFQRLLSKRDLLFGLVRLMEAATQPDRERRPPTHERRPWLIVFLPVNRAPPRDALDE